MSILDEAILLQYHGRVAKNRKS